MARAAVSATDVDRVLLAWRERMRRPDLVRLTDDRKKLVAQRLRAGFTADDLLAVVRYAFESQDRIPRWWRGENEDRATYLDIESLLRAEKLGGRVTAALEWAERVGEQGEAVPENVIRFGASARFRS